MPKNVIILTTGLAGSSPLAGIIARAGHWTGSRTFKKSDYDTYENQALIDLNKRLFDETGYDGKYEMEFSAAAIRNIEGAVGSLDPGPWKSFVATCEEHRPWIWKDPRLWLTIRYWAPLLPLEDIQFILLTRDHLQSWISTTIRRQIHSYGYAKRYTEQVRASILEFLGRHGLPHLELTFEGLVMHPERTVQALNDFLGTGLTMDDVRAVYNKPLYKRPRGTLDFLKAVSIYLKNYSSRYR